MEINRKSRVPVYWQIKELILDEIKTGILKPGDKILSEPQLVEKYVVSRPTARNAVTELVNEGYLVRKQGLGTFVQKPRIENEQENFKGFKADMEERGFIVHSELLGAEKKKTSEEVRDALALKGSDEIYRIKRLRFANNEPIVIHESCIPAKSCPGLLEYDFTKESLYTLFHNKYGKIIVNATEHLEAIEADKEVARLLNISKGKPVLYIQRISFLTGGTPFELSRSWYRGDRYTFDIYLQRNHGA